ncbi:hypothetical protein SNE510_69030 [Streptomyces sp. NE5-10]|uniref:hypothetical protein n=1 Tax=Streptomyces sp. NE5-10 TaxID=2759674 RepID=UPI0019060140|nr:hypothetical protein [Streptomyces sp. NE5-10]GHJ97384.1 hypothetical protein SNE510_69030 [Streptomyces sp. NE5-10]
MSNDQPYGVPPHDPNAYDPSVTQTWEGQTWDTTYQPAIRPEDAHGHAAAQRQPYAYGQEHGQEAYPQEAYPQAYAQPEPYPQYAPPEPYAPGHARPPQQHPQQQYSPPMPEAHAPAPVAVPTPAPAPAPAPAAEAADGPAYSSPTTSGNTRVTDAQRARAEGRSPIIEPGMRPAALTALLGLLLAGGAALGTYGLLLPLVALQGLTAAGWFRLNGMWPARQGIALAFLGGLVADAALLATGREHAAPAILGTLGVWVLLSLVLQLRSHADPDERMYGLMATIASAALTVLAAGHLGAEPDAVVAGSVAVSATVLARALPLPGPVSLVVSLLAAAGAGIAAGTLGGMGASGALLGLATGVCALVGLRVASYDYPSRFVHMTAGVALPLTAAAPAVYLLGRALV